MEKFKCNIDFDKLENLNKLKDSMNEIIDRKINESRVRENIEAIQKLPLMTCRDLLTLALPKLYESEDGKKTLKKYLKFLSENKDVTRLIILMESMKRQNRTTNPELYIYNSTSMFANGDTKLLKETISLYKNMVGEAILMSTVDYNDLKETIEKDKSINEALDVLFCEKKSVTNIDTYTDSMNLVLETIRQNCADRKMLDEATPISSDNIKDNVNALKEMTNNPDLEQWERETIGMVIEARLAGNMEKLFEDCKEECMISVLAKRNVSDENEAVKNKMGLMYEQLAKKIYNEETVVTDILKLKDLQRTINS